MLIMAAVLPAHHHRNLSRLLLIHLLLLVSQVVAFSWHGAYKSLPSTRSMAYSGWQPDPFWWRSRRRNPPSPRISVGDWLGLKNQHQHQQHQHAGSEQVSDDSFLELDNSIPTVAQPAFAVPRLQSERVGWRFLQPQNQFPHRVSLHYSTRAFSSPGAMNRRNKLDMVKAELDQEVMKNVIRQVLNQEQHRGMETPVKAMKTPAVASSKVHAQVTPSAPAQEQTGHISKSSPEDSYRQSFAAQTGFGEAFPVEQNSDFSNLGFGSFVDSADLSDGFGQQPVDRPSQGSQGPSFVGSESLGGFGGGDHSPPGGFGGFGKENIAVGHFGWLDGQGGSPAQIEPIPTAAVSMGSFSENDAIEANIARLAGVLR
ncbi:hypothetical protein ACOMHN_041297 [Nucella lapillus]